MKKLLLSLGAFALVALIGCQKNESNGIAVINMSKVFASHPALKLIEPKVNAQKSGVQNKVQQAAKVISAKEKKLNAIAQDKEIELEKKQMLAKEIYADRAKLNKFVQKGNQQLSAMHMNVRNQLLASLIKLVEAYRVENNYSFVFDYSGMTGNNMAAVICFDKKHDITDHIVKKVSELKVAYKKDAELPVTTPQKTEETK